jgi:hypothetical protein
MTTRGQTSAEPQPKERDLRVASPPEAGHVLENRKRSGWFTLSRRKRRANFRPRPSSSNGKTSRTRPISLAFGCGLSVFSVAQTCNLPFRRIAFCALPAVRGCWNISTLCRLQIGETADYKSALRRRSGWLNRYLGFLAPHRASFL